jgi:hypothetical protein
LKNKWPPGHPVAATKFRENTRSSGRFQRAHHQCIVFEIEVMIVHSGEALPGQADFETACANSCAFESRRPYLT